VGVGSISAVEVGELVGVLLGKGAGAVVGRPQADKNIARPTDRWMIILIFDFIFSSTSVLIRVPSILSAGQFIFIDPSPGLIKTW